MGESAIGTFPRMVHATYQWQLDLQENACLMTRLWCSYRHQTLARTIRGIHNYEKALALLGEHEIGSNATAGTTDVKHYALLLARHNVTLTLSTGMLFVLKRPLTLRALSRTRSNAVE